MVARDRGMSLIELLVAIAIIAVLIGLLLPALGQARQAALSTQCQTRQRQLGQATFMHQHEHAGRFPQPFEDQAIINTRGADAAGRALWFNALDAYLQRERADYQAGLPASRNQARVKQCPAWDALAVERREVNRTVKMNGAFGLSSRTQYRFYTDAHVSRPSQTVLMVDGRAHDVAPQAEAVYDHFHASPGTVGLRHSGGANVLFVDGHVSHQRQAVNELLEVDGWYTEASGRQTLVWDFR